MTDRVRQWGATVFPGEKVQCRNYAVLAPGEQLTDDPPTVNITWADWLRDHETVYGLTVDGTLLADDASLRAAITRLKNSANASPARTLDSTDAKAILRIFKEINVRLDAS